MGTKGSLDSPKRRSEQYLLLMAVFKHVCNFEFGPSLYIAYSDDLHAKLDMGGRMVASVPINIFLLGS